MKTLGRAIARQDTGAIARAAWSVVRSDLVKELRRIVSLECGVMCDPSRNSMLRRTSITSLKSFSTSGVVDELKKDAPVLYDVLTAAMGQVSSKAMCHMTMAGACLLKARNPRMSALQYVVGTFLYQSGLKRRSFVRLNRLGVCMSPKSQRTKLKAMATDFDKSILQTKAVLEYQQLGASALVRPTEGPSESCSAQFLDNDGDSDEDTDVDLESDLTDGESLTSAGEDSFEDETDGDVTGTTSIVHEMDRSVDFHPSHSESATVYQVTGDNLDLSIRAKYMSLTRRNQSLHWFNLVATDERFPVPHDLSEQTPRCSVMDVDNTSFILNTCELESIRKDLIVLAARTLTTHLKGLLPFSEIVPSHIKHDFSDVAAKKSKQLPLGLLELNEQKQQDMIQICRFLSGRYVPYAHGRPVKRVQFGGDQLTAERSRSSLLALADADKDEQKLSGLIPHAEDFHCHMKFVELIMSKFYAERSYGEIGTLRQLKGLLDRRNVAKTAKDIRATYAFVEDVLDGFLIAAAMKHFGLSSIEDDVVPPGIPDRQRAAWFWEAVGRLVDQYVLAGLGDSIETLHSSSAGRDSIQPSTDSDHLEPPQSAVAFEHSVNVGIRDTQTVACRWPGCRDVLSNARHRTAHEKRCHGMMIQDRRKRDSPSSAAEPADSMKDGVFCYASNFMEMALVERNFRDAWAEMDGPRLFRLWKLKMLYFKQSGHHKYALEGFLFQADQYALLSPMDAHRQLWERAFNLKGGAGNNIPLDLMVEHSNNYAKEMIHNQGANVTFNSSQRITRAANTTKEVLDNFDKSIRLKLESGQHTRSNRSADILQVVKCLHSNSILSKEAGRVHCSFPKVELSELKSLTGELLLKWIQKVKRNCHITQELSLHK